MTWADVLPPGTGRAFNSVDLDFEKDERGAKKGTRRRRRRRGGGGGGCCCCCCCCVVAVDDEARSTSMAPSDRSAAPASVYNKIWVPPNPERAKALWQPNVDGSKSRRSPCDESQNLRSSNSPFWGQGCCGRITFSKSRIGSGLQKGIGWCCHGNRPC